MFSSHGKREILLTLLVCACLSALAVRYVPYLVPVPVLLFLFTLYFFRDPDRNVPEDENVLVSPADGKVADIIETKETVFLNEPCLRIGIFLSVFDVHVNRSPAEATVQTCHYTKGAFHNAMMPEASTENESNLLGFERDGLSFSVKQIAGMIARRIICTTPEGTKVERGERIGMIKFGSRTELYVPLRYKPEVVVEEGDRVYGASSIVVEINQDS